MRRSCPACINVLAPGSKQFGTQTVDHLAEVRIALVKRFQTHEDKAAIGGAAAARERHGVGHRRVRFDDIDDALRGFLHGLERNILRTLDAAEDDAVILLRERILSGRSKKGRS
jgi:hypothetical protein